MFQPVYTKQFHKDGKRCQKRGKNLERFKIIARDPLAGKSPDPIHRDHQLVGNDIGRRECHIEADWLLIYQTETSRIVFERMGSHSDLFK